MFGDAMFGFWNPWSHCNKRHEYVQSLNIDVLGLGELHNKHCDKLYEGKRLICSERAEPDELGVNPDPAAGVAILLSSRMADRLLDSGCVGTRVAYTYHH